MLPLTEINYEKNTQTLRNRTHPTAQRKRCCRLHWPQLPSLSEAIGCQFVPSHLHQWCCEQGWNVTQLSNMSPASCFNLFTGKEWTNKAVPPKSLNLKQKSSFFCVNIATTSEVKPADRNTRWHFQASLLTEILGHFQASQQTEMLGHF